MENKYICIHGHFYQPPRENAWLERIEQQDSAYPYHDWNSRITAECYEPNAASRILAEDNKIVEIVNNYSKISFNFGPTLLSWLEFREPSVYNAILEADKLSQEMYSGHGSAIAQAYNHMIMPLANERDKRTQVIWGIRDFESRFGRKPEGMWLPETAVNTETLEILADYGIEFTILAPGQASKFRRLGEKDWQDASGGKVDPRRAYRYNLPNGKFINLFFYEGSVSSALAFEGLLKNGKIFLTGYSIFLKILLIVHNSRILQLTGNLTVTITGMVIWPFRFACITSSQITWQKLPSIASFSKRTHRSTRCRSTRIAHGVVHMV